MSTNDTRTPLEAIADLADLLSDHYFICDLRERLTYTELTTVARFIEAVRPEAREARFEWLQGDIEEAAGLWDDPERDAAMRAEYKRLTGRPWPTDDEEN